MAGLRVGDLKYIWRSRNEKSTSKFIPSSLSYFVAPSCMEAKPSWVIKKTEEHKLVAFQNRMLQRLVGAGKEEFVNIKNQRKKCKCLNIHERFVNVLQEKLI